MQAPEPAIKAPPIVTNREDCWPDPVHNDQAMADDVSQFNATPVQGIYQVRGIDDIKTVLLEARSAGLHVSTRGAKHSMGGHSIARNGLIIDMQYIVHMQYNMKDDTVTVGTGAMWSDLIKYLNQFGRAPRTLQSYCSFSVGGTLSVNGHGITTDFVMAESVLSFTLIKADGEQVTCARDAKETEQRELFRLCLGGYGLFGIIFEVTLKVNPNVRLAMDSMTVSAKDFPYLYESTLQAPDVEMKLARLDITTFDFLEFFVFRKDCDTPTVSNLPVKPKEMTAAGRLMYKWFAGPLREARFYIEREFGVVDDRNMMLYESAAPLARLYSPLQYFQLLCDSVLPPQLKIDDTFILQEYFIPKENFGAFLLDLKEIVLRKLHKESLLTLLNISVRFVQEDKDSALPYARSSKGMFAFVFYFRVRQSAAADELLKSYHIALVNLTLRESGTFYLPYRHHYTDEQLLQAYPGFKQFSEQKLRFDPTGLFTNLWWDRYGPKRDAASMKVAPVAGADANRKEIQPLANFQLPNVSTHRTNSFKQLLASPKLRQQFMDSFLVEIFAARSPKEIHQHMSAAAWHVHNKDDNDIYVAMQESLAKRTGPISQLTGVWNQLKQLADQKKELTREIISILARMGKLGQIHNYCSIGDHGRLVIPLRKALGMQGKAWIAHDVNGSGGSETDTTAVLERASVKGADVGEFVMMDYNNIRSEGRELRSIPDGACDLVTMNQGLHHLPPDRVMSFLAAVRRVLRPGGLFIVREHDLDQEGTLMPMLDCAHMVFNAVTGVTPKLERDEIRGSVLQWREIIEAAGLRDSMLYEMQPNDPTWDVMMCFYKPPFQAKCNPVLVPSPSAAIAVTVPPLQFALNQVPAFALDSGVRVLDMLFDLLPKLRTLLADAVGRFVPDTPGLRKVVSILVDQYINPAITMLERFRPLTDAAETVKGAGAEFVPDEFFLLLPLLRIRASQGGMLEAVLVSIVDKVMHYFNKMFEAPEPEQSSGSVQDIQAELTEAEVSKEIDLLIQSIPTLSDPDTVIANFGLPNKAAALARSAMAGGGGAASRKWFLEKVDRRGWTALCSALKQVRTEKKALLLTEVTQKDSGWNKAAMAVLGCPRVQLTSTQALLASGAGLGPLVDLWKEAQQARRVADACDPGRLSPAVVNVMKPPLDAVCPEAEYSGDGRDELSGVLCVVSASYIAEALTFLVKDTVKDVTAQVAAHLDPIRGVLYLNRVALPTTLRLGQHKLVVKYRMIPKMQDTQLFLKRTTALAQVLTREGLASGSRASSGPQTWFKLPEWMQVEIVQLLGNSMNHTPWYRFPFMDLLKTYFSVFGQVLSIVAERHGWAGALGSSGLVTDLVPGITMAAGFMQMYILAYPLRRFLGGDYDKNKLVEQLIIAAPRGIKWSEIDPRVSLVTEVVGGLWVMNLPTFKPFTEVLMQIATELPSATLLQISNQFVVQMRVEVPGSRKDSLKCLKAISGCDLKFEFEYPHVGGDQRPLTQVLFAVLVPVLLSVLRACINNNITIVQVYDFYGS